MDFRRVSHSTRDSSDPFFPPHQTLLRSSQKNYSAIHLLFTSNSPAPKLRPIKPKKILINRLCCPDREMRLWNFIDRKLKSSAVDDFRIRPFIRVGKAPINLSQMFERWLGQRVFTFAVVEDFSSVDCAQIGAGHMNARFGVSETDTIPRRPLSIYIPARQAKIRCHVALRKDRDAMPDVLNDVSYICLLDNERARWQSATSPLVSLHATQYCPINAQVGLGCFEAETFPTYVMILLPRLHNKISVGLNGFTFFANSTNWSFKRKFNCCEHTDPMRVRWQYGKWKAPSTRS